MRIEDYKILIGNTLEEITPEIVAELFANMKSDQQAVFFSRLGALVGDWAAGCMALQLQYVTDDAALTPAGRQVMQEIGEYSQNTRADERTGLLGVGPFFTQLPSQTPRPLPEPPAARSQPEPPGTP